MEIIPAIMPKNYKDLEDHVERVLNDRVGIVQLDIMDGGFVPERTWPFRQGFDDEGNFSDAVWNDVQEGDRGLPHWNILDYELDLMVRHPEKMLEAWLALGPARIIFHLESLADPVRVLQEMQGLRDTVEVGLSLDNDTPVGDLYPHLEVIDCVQFMGIAQIGYQGQAFDERVIDRIRELQSHDPSVCIQVDGSVNNETIEELEKIGVERFVVGSAFFG